MFPPFKRESLCLIAHLSGEMRKPIQDISSGQDSGGQSLPVQLLGGAGYHDEVHLRLLAVTTLVAGTAVASSSARPLTTAPNLFVKVHVTLSDKKITVYPKRAPRGTDAQFIVRNVGKKVHTFTLGTQKRGQGIQTGFSRSVKPGRQLLLLLYLNYRGVLGYYSNTAVDRNNPAMRGKFTVGEDVAGSVNP
jgi:hypothetical protein